MMIMKKIRFLLRNPLYIIGNPLYLIGKPMYTFGKSIRRNIKIVITKLNYIMKIINFRNIKKNIILKIYSSKLIPLILAISTKL